MKTILNKLKSYYSLIKSLQTSLLLVTGVTGYVSARVPEVNWETLIGLIGSLFLTISGSTVLNMVYDRDIDYRMERTMHRPLPSGKVSVREAFVLGMFLSLSGIVWAISLAPLYALIVFAGLFLDVVVYTLWLKRRTPWAIVWGGISGGMPILAGRVLGIGGIDYIGILLSLSILLWIPTHILTFSMRFFNDYRRAGIPTFPSVYGHKKTRLIIAVSSLGAAVAIGIGSYALHLAGGYLRLLSVLSAGIIGLAIISVYKPSEKINFGLFKYASIYMLGAMIMLIFGALG